MNDTLLARVASDLTPVEPLPPPIVRALALTPFAVLLLVAAPLAFDFRNLGALGWFWSWGASIAQLIVGLTVVAVALRESVPGRHWPLPALIALLSAVVLLFIAVTWGTWSASPVRLARQWWLIGAMCAGASAASALPAVALSSILVVRAYPVRPAFTGFLAGLGSGLLADAGWRLFCHFSEPTHVITAHLGGVLLAAVAGAWLTTRLSRR